MFQWQTKEQVDEHARSGLAKEQSDHGRQMRSFHIAKLYHHIGEYAIAESYMWAYLIAKKDNFEAYNTLGNCCQHLKKPRQALEWFKESLKLNADQPGLLDTVCRLFDEERNLDITQAEYWYEFAELHKENHDVELPLRLQILIKQYHAEVPIREKISANPSDMQLRLRLVRHYLDMNKMLEVAKYICSIELNMEFYFESSGEWYDKIGAMLGEFERLPIIRKDWEFWLTMVMCLERRVFFSLLSGKSEAANLLLKLDHYVFKVSAIAHQFCEQKELVLLFLEHYHGQTLLYAASLLLKRQLVQNEHKWTEASNAALPLLLLAFQAEVPDGMEEWMKHSKEFGNQLTKFWIREGSFRCAQAGRTLLSCVDKGGLDMGNADVPVNESKKFLTRIRQICCDKRWRQNVFSMLFPDCVMNVKESSMIMTSRMLEKPLFEMPKYQQVESFEQASLYLKPQSLEHVVYLHLSSDNLSHITADIFILLKFSTSDLAVCGSETFNQLDVDTFLYAAIIQAKRSLDCEFESFETCNDGGAYRPRIFPFVNLHGELCTEAQRDWWLTAYQFYKKISNDNRAALRRNLQSGIEVIRGIDGPKPHMIIMFKLGQIFAKRAQNTKNTEKKAFLEARAEFNYKYGLKIFKMKYRDIIEPYFKYANPKTLKVHHQLESMYREARLYLAERCGDTSEDEYSVVESEDIQGDFLSDHKVNEAAKKAEQTFVNMCEAFSNANSVLSDTESSFKLIGHGTASNPSAALAETSFITVEDERKLKTLIQEMANNVKFLTTQLTDIVIPGINGMRSEIKALDLRVSNVVEDMKRMRLVKLRSRQNPSNLSQMTMPRGIFSNTSGNIYTHSFLPNIQQQQQQNYAATIPVYNAPIFYPNYLQPQSDVANVSVAGLIGQGSVPYINSSINLNLAPGVHLLQPTNQSTSGSFCGLPNQQS